MPNRFSAARLGPTAKPKTFNLIVAKGKVLNGIYKYDDGFYFCFGDKNCRLTTDPNI